MLGGLVLRLELTVTPSLTLLTYLLTYLLRRFIVAEPHRRLAQVQRNTV